MHPTEEDRELILDGYEMGAEGLRDMMTLSFDQVLIALVLAVFIVAISWSWINKKGG